jgi:hypothetical protein
MGIRDDTPHKNHRIVGEVLGKYHPMEILLYMTRMARGQIFQNAIAGGWAGQLCSVDGDPACSYALTPRRGFHPLPLNPAPADDTVDTSTILMETLKAARKYTINDPEYAGKRASGMAGGHGNHIPPHNLGSVDAL